LKLRCPKCNEESELDSFQKHYEQGELDQLKAKLSANDFSSEEARKLKNEVVQLKCELDQAREEAKAAEVKASESDLMIDRIGKKSREVTRAASRSNSELEGEAAELRLEQQVRGNFPDDNIEPIAKGAPGADIIQSVTTKSGRNIATIILESKTGYKSFQSKWITKHSQDINDHDGDVGILVTDVFPANSTGVPAYQSPDDDRIWVCHPDFALVAIKLIRDGLIKENKQKVVTKHATETTKDSVYKYMTGDFVDQLKLQIKVKLEMEAILEKEKTAYLSRLKARKKHLDLLTSSIVDIVGVVSAIGLPNFELEQIVAPNSD
tara:strand:+ start:9749 stop:10714 length:966 start_codon:yes stop_codon:yes gene_type:complete